MRSDGADGGGDWDGNGDEDGIDGGGDDSIHVRLAWPHRRAPNVDTGDATRSAGRRTTLATVTWHTLKLSHCILVDMKLERHIWSRVTWEHGQRKWLNGASEKAVTTVPLHQPRPTTSAAMRAERRMKEIEADVDRKGGRERGDNMYAVTLHVTTLSSSDTDLMVSVEGKRHDGRCSDTPWAHGADDMTRTTNWGECNIEDIASYGMMMLACIVSARARGSRKGARRIRMQPCRRIGGRRYGAARRRYYGAGANGNCRGPKVCNFFKWRDCKICYKRDANLFLTFLTTCEDMNGDEMAAPEAIHHFVEYLDRYFGRGGTVIGGGWGMQAVRGDAVGKGSM